MKFKIFRVLGNDKQFCDGVDSKNSRFYSRLNGIDYCTNVGGGSLFECQTEIRYSSTYTGLFTRQHMATRIRNRCICPLLLR